MTSPFAIYICWRNKSLFKSHYGAWESQRSIKTLNFMWAASNTNHNPSLWNTNGLCIRLQTLMIFFFKVLKLPTNKIAFVLVLGKCDSSSHAKKVAFHLMFSHSPVDPEIISACFGRLRISAHWNCSSCSYENYLKEHLRYSRCN